MRRWWLTVALAAAVGLAGLSEAGPRLAARIGTDATVTVLSVAVATYIVACAMAGELWRTFNRRAVRQEGGDHGI
jgi:hypothetical protein